MNLIQGFKMGNGKSDLLFHYSEGLIIGLITNSLIVSDWMLWLKDILSSSIFFFFCISACISERDTTGALKTLENKLVPPSLTEAIISDSHKKKEKEKR